MNDSLLSRQVKSDKKGLFIFYGGWRFYPSRGTRTNLGAWILLESPFYREDDKAIVRIGNRRETWRQRGIPKNEVPFFSKRIRLTDHNASLRSSLFDDRPMVTLVKS